MLQCNSGIGTKLGEELGQINLIKGKLHFSTPIHLRDLLFDGWPFSCNPSRFYRTKAFSSVKVRSVSDFLINLFSASRFLLLIVSQTARARLFIRTFFNNIIEARSPVADFMQRQAGPSLLKTFT